jgi:hypothetical protein
MNFSTGQRVWLARPWHHPILGRLLEGTGGTTSRIHGPSGVDVVYDHTDGLPVVTSPSSLVAVRSCPDGHGVMRLRVAWQPKTEHRGVPEEPGFWGAPPVVIVLIHVCDACGYEIVDADGSPCSTGRSTPEGRRPARAAPAAAIEAHGDSSGADKGF